MTLQSAGTRETRGTRRKGILVLPGSFQRSSFWPSRVSYIQETASEWHWWLLSTEISLWEGWVICPWSEWKLERELGQELTVWLPVPSTSQWQCTACIILLPANCKCSLSSSDRQVLFTFQMQKHHRNSLCLQGFGLETVHQCILCIYFMLIWLCPKCFTTELLLRNAYLKALHLALLGKLSVISPSLSVQTGNWTPNPQNLPCAQTSQRSANLWSGEGFLFLGCSNLANQKDSTVSRSSHTSEP